MDFGYIRVAAAVPEVQVADCAYNVQKMLELAKDGEQKEVQVMVFPELSITAYTCGDLFYNTVLLDAAEDGLSQLLRQTAQSGMTVIAGLPVRLDNQLFNCGVVIQGGRVLAAVPKSYLPNYGEFYEKRWFSPAHMAVSRVVELCGQRDIPFGPNILLRSGQVCIGVEICQDLWVPVPPSSFHCMQGANLIFNLSASNEIIGKHEYRRELIRQQSARCVTGYIYTSSGVGESTTDLVFSGHAVVAENGSVLAESQRFSQQGQLLVGDIDISLLTADRKRTSGFMELPLQGWGKQEYRAVVFDLKPCSTQAQMRAFNPHPFVPSAGADRDQRCEEIFTIQSTGLAKRMRHTGLTKAVIGVSGGLDSTLALLVTVRAADDLGVGRDSVTGVTMPGFGTTGRTYNNAVNLMKALGVTVMEVDIKAACLQHFQDIGHDPEIHNVTYENAQARERTQILMDMANQQNALVVGTGDLSELALGWTTYNGDHMSMYGVNGGVPKTLVRYLVKWAAGQYEGGDVAKILRDILDTPVSPELLPTDGQKVVQETENIVGPYELHDFFLYYLVRFGFSPGKIIYMAERAFAGQYDRETILRWLELFHNRFFTQQFKRSCLPDGPKVGSINLSPRGDWRMPSDASCALWSAELEALKQM